MHKNALRKKIRSILRLGGLYDKDTQVKTHKSKINKQIDKQRCCSNIMAFSTVKL